MENKGHYIFGFGIGLVIAALVGLIFIDKFNISVYKTFAIIAASGGVTLIANTWLIGKAKDNDDEIVDIPNQEEQKAEEDEEQSAETTEDLGIEQV